MLLATIALTFSLTAADAVKSRGFTCTTSERHPAQWRTTNDCTSEIADGDKTTWAQGKGVHFQQWAELDLGVKWTVESVTVNYWSGSRCTAPFSVQVLRCGPNDLCTFEPWCNNMQTTASGSTTCEIGGMVGVEKIRIVKSASVGCWPGQPNDNWFRLTGVTVYGYDRRRLDEGEVEEMEAPSEPVADLDFLEMFSTLDELQHLLDASPEEDTTTADLLVHELQDSFDDEGEDELRRQGTDTTCNDPLYSEGVCPQVHFGCQTVDCFPTRLRCDHKCRFERIVGAPAVGTKLCCSSQRHFECREGPRYLYHSASTSWLASQPIRNKVCLLATVPEHWRLVGHSFDVAPGGFFKCCCNSWGREGSRDPHDYTFTRQYGC